MWYINEITNEIYWVSQTDGVWITNSSTSSQFYFQFKKEKQMSGFIRLSMSDVIWFKDSLISVDLTARGHKGTTLCGGDDPSVVEDIKVETYIDGKYVDITEDLDQDTYHQVTDTLYELMYE